MNSFAKELRALKEKKQKKVVNFNPRDVPKVKKIVNFLNEKFAEKYSQDTVYHDGEEMKLFLGFFPWVGAKAEMQWHICCSNIWVYNSEKFKVYRKMMYKKYPDLPMFFICVFKMGMWGMVKHKEGTIIK